MAKKKIGIATHHTSREKRTFVGASASQPPACPGETKVKRVENLGLHMFCNPGVICAEGTATHNEHAITSVKGKIFETSETIEGNAPSTGYTSGQFNGNSWYFDAEHHNEIGHLEIGYVGKSMNFVVWIEFADGYKDRVIVTFCVSEYDKKLTVIPSVGPAWFRANLNCGEDILCCTSLLCCRSCDGAEDHGDGESTFFRSFAVVLVLILFTWNSQPWPPIGVTVVLGLLVMALWQYMEQRWRRLIISTSALLRSTEVVGRGLQKEVSRRHLLLLTTGPSRVIHDKTKEILSASEQQRAHAGD